MSSWYKAGSSRGSPPVVSAGEIIELQVYDDAGNTQGTILLGVRKVVSRAKAGVVIEAVFLAASDIYYHWWMNDSGDAPSKVDGLYHLCAAATKDCPPNPKHPEMVHGDRYRNLGTQVHGSKQVPWLRDRTIYEGFMFSLGKFEALMGGGPTEKKRAPKEPAEAEWEDDRYPSEEGASPHETDEDEETEDEDMKARIKKLRAELKKAEDDAADKRRGKKTSGSRRALASGSAKDKKKKRAMDSAGTGRHHRGKSDRDRTPEKSDEKKPKKKRRHRSRSKEHARKGASPSKRARASHPVEPEGSEESSKQELFKSKRGGEAKTKEADQDRGPFGGGAPVKFKGDDSDSSSSESSFRKASSTTAKSSQQRLLAYTNKHPGRLASRMLLKMEHATARGVEGPAQSAGNRTPAVAMNHVLTILLPSLGQKAGLRSTRELKTLGAILDHLARGTPSKAADVVAQRIKAVERASHESHWGSAQFLELLPPENSMLLDKDEEMYVAKEYLLEQRLRDYDRRGGQRREIAEGKGKAKGAKGKTKDREKGDRGAWDKTDKTGKKPDSK